LLQVQIRRAEKSSERIAFDKGDLTIQQVPSRPHNPEVVYGGERVKIAFHRQLHFDEETRRNQRPALFGVPY
jgi:hypothetical protein